MVVVKPPAIPVTTPVDMPTVATVVAVLLHVPPETLLVSEMVWPAQTDEGPEIVPGDGLTITTIEVEQPEDNI